MNPSLKVLLCVSACTAGLSASEAARAADTNSANDARSGVELGELVVTAQKREQSLQEVPASIAAIGGGVLDQRGIGGGNEPAISGSRVYSPAPSIACTISIP